MEAKIKQGKKTTRVQQKNKKPIKVKYISSPMKIQTSASRFRSLVQELTGQYAGELPTDFSGNPVVPDVAKTSPDSVEENLVVMEGSSSSNEFVPDYFLPIDAESDLAFKIDEDFSGYFPAGVYSFESFDGLGSLN